MLQQGDVHAMIAKIVRERSVAGKLTHFREILTEVQARGLLQSSDIDVTAELTAALGQVLGENPDLREICGRDGIRWYYSLQSLTETYAAILVSKADSPLWLIAQVVRDNSRRYPRPVPADSFREAPFELTGEEMSEFLKALGTEEDYQDIAQTTTSIGTAYLYSKRHLDPDHAAMLAEWFDVGQANNP